MSDLTRQQKPRKINNELHVTYGRPITRQERANVIGLVARQDGARELVEALGLSAWVHFEHCPCSSVAVVCERPWKGGQRLCTECRCVDDAA